MDFLCRKQKLRHGSIFVPYYTWECRRGIAHTLSRFSPHYGFSLYIFLTFPFIEFSLYGQNCASCARWMPTFHSHHLRSSTATHIRNLISKDYYFTCTKRHHTDVCKKVTLSNPELISLAELKETHTVSVCSRQIKFLVWEPIWYIFQFLNLSKYIDRWALWTFCFCNYREQLCFYVFRRNMFFRTWRLPKRTTEKNSEN